jgi:hypothetical protein
MGLAGAAVGASEGTDVVGENEGLAVVGDLDGAEVVGPKLGLEDVGDFVGALDGVLDGFEVDGLVVGLIFAARITWKQPNTKKHMKTIRSKLHILAIFLVSYR